MSKKKILVICLTTVFLSTAALADPFGMPMANIQKYDKEDRVAATLEEYKQAASGGDVDAMSTIGHMYFEGEGVPQDYDAAMEWYKKAANNGDVDAIIKIGYMYFEGLGFPKDDYIALEWYTRAADRGDVSSMSIVGYMYFEGEGALRDYDAAMEWYKKAANNGDVDAMIKIGYMYFKGLGVPQDGYIALEWYVKAANKGDVNSMNTIGYMYFVGLGVPQNEHIAIEWHEKAADKGSTFAMNAIGYIYSLEGDTENDNIALEWYKKAANKGDVSAMVYVGNMYSSERDSDENYQIAMDWYRKAANKGDVYAMNNIGDLYAYGKGVSQDKYTAAQWYIKAYKIAKLKVENQGTTQSNNLLIRIRRSLDSLVTSSEIANSIISREIESLFDKPPLIAWKTQPPSTVDSESLTLSVNLTDQGGGIGDIRVLIDGIAVDQSGRGLYRKVNQEAQDFTLTIPEGEHTLTVEAYAAENLGATNKVTHQIISKYKPLQKPKLHAVIIGINTYQNPDLKLVNAVNDADAIYKTLNKQIGSLYDKGSISLLNTVDTTSREHIINKIILIKQTAKMGDVFVFYAAAHGYNFPDTGYHLFTSDVGATSSRQVKTTGISAYELQGLLAQVTTDKKLILLDTCDSGGSIDAGQLLASRGLDDKKVIDSMQRKSGATVIMASTDRQKALEKYKGHGVFTYSLLQAFAGKGDIDENKYISTIELIQHVEKNVPLLAEEVFNRQQHPTTSMIGNSFEFKVFK